MTPLHIVVGLDGSAHARAALEWVCHLAERSDATVTAVHALGLLETIDGQIVPTEQHRAEITARMEQEWSRIDSDITIRAECRDGPPVDVLAAAADQLAADLLVVGRHGSGYHPAAAIGSTSAILAQTSPCPVLVVPPPS